ncbi:MAG: class I SAM-dependent methyltransferase [Massiliimalia sp.]|jgi:ubiquinone/menaquinone biosynthesis C-methylase UbiE
MKENKYDNSTFFEKYSQMDRSKRGLDGAGEWETLQKMLPDFQDKTVLDLGCGYGWHCIYALQHGAASVTGVDISQKMLAVAQEKLSQFPQLKDRCTFTCCPIEDIHYPDASFDAVISSLAFHYLESFDSIAKIVNKLLRDGGTFTFSVEHPVFTAYGSQDWYYDDQGNILHFPVDNYYYEGKREACFLGEPVTKYHKTLTTYLNGLLTNGFQITGVQEPMPPARLLDTVPGMRDEMRRPMMLIVSAQKLGTKL